MSGLRKIRDNKETQISSVSDITLLDTKFLSNFYFRGQANAEWILSSSLERMVKSYYHHEDFFHLLPRYESDMLQEFKWKYPLYEKNIIPSNDDNLEWLSLMQHYGACTRLLDATESIFVALFMAMQNTFINTDAAIWAINKNILNENKTKQYKKDTKCKSSIIPFSDAESYSYDFANSFIGKVFQRGECQQQIIAIKPKMCNERIAIQQGLFLMPTDITVPFMRNLDHYLSGDLYFNKIEYPKFVEYSKDNKHKSYNEDILMFKIVIPHTLKFGITNLLSQMNISAETLFPGLSGLSASLNKLRDGFAEYVE